MNKKIYLILLFLIFTACGFELEKNLNTTNFYISEVKTAGDKRINYLIKNYLLSASKSDGNTSISIKIDTKKIKTISEKNIKNEPTKYQIQIDTTVKSNIDGKENEIILSEIGEYSVHDQYSQTLSRERKLVENLTNEISEMIVSTLIKY